MELFKLIMEQKLFSLKTFGPVPRLNGVQDHLCREIKELIKDRDDLSEWSDCLLLSIDGAIRAGMAIEELSGLLHLNCGQAASRESDFRQRAIYQLERDIFLLANDVNNKERWAFIGRKIIVNAKSNGISSDLLIQSAFEKLEINKSRNWPDWRSVDENKAIEHIKT